MTENTAVVATIEDDVQLGSREVTTLINRLGSALGQLNTDSGLLSTIPLDDEDGQDIALVAMTSAERLEDNLNKEFNLKHFVVQRGEVLDEESGELRDSARIILIKDDGTAFSTGSASVASSLGAIVQLRGEPSSWKTASRVMVEKTETRQRRTAFALRYLGRVPAKK